MSPKVTVIMPSLNVAEYIKTCMESVLAQTMQELEILAIDAGSTDGTLEILQEYAKKDKRIRIVNSEKRSYGYQLNMGISLAAGEYVGVVETDDLIVHEMYERLYQEAVRTGADYVKGAVQLFLEVSPGLYWKRPIDHTFGDDDMYGKVLSPRSMPELFLKDYYLWSGIYKRDFIRQIKLNETPGAAYQDAGFMFQSYMKAERAVYLREVFYWYRQDNMGASTYNRRAFEFFIKEYDYMEKFLQGASKEWREVYYLRMLYHCRRKIFVMGVTGEFWNDALPDMEEMQGRLRSARQQDILNEQVLPHELEEELGLLLESPRALYEHYATLYRPKADNIHAMLEKAAGQDAVIFGSGKRGCYMHMLMEYKRPGTVKAFCDNQDKLWGTAVQGIPVMSPEEADQRYPKAVYLIAGKKYEAQMRQQLGRLGVDEERMFTYTAGEEMLLFHI